MNKKDKGIFLNYQDILNELKEFSTSNKKIHWVDDWC